VTNFQYRSVVLAIGSPAFALWRVLMGVRDHSRFPKIPETSAALRSVLLITARKSKDSAPYFADNMTLEQKVRAGRQR